MTVLIAGKPTNLASVEELASVIRSWERGDTDASEAAADLCLQELILRARRLSPPLPVPDNGCPSATISQMMEFDDVQRRKEIIAHNDLREAKSLKAVKDELLWWRQNFSLYTKDSDFVAEHNKLKQELATTKESLQIVDASCAILSKRAGAIRDLLGIPAKVVDDVQWLKAVLEENGLASEQFIFDIYLQTVKNKLAAYKRTIDSAKRALG